MNSSTKPLRSSAAKHPQRSQLRREASHFVERRSHAVRGVENSAVGESIERYLLARHVPICGIPLCGNVPFGGLARRDPPYGGAPHPFGCTSVLARAQAMIHRRASIFSFLLIAIAIMAMASRRSLVAADFIGQAIQVASFALMIWARISFGSRSFHFAANPTQGGLVTSGPYRYLRHPIYAAILFFIWAGALSHLSAIDVVLALTITVSTAVRIFTEEKLVVAMYPEYQEYASHTKRIVPFVF